MYGYTWLYARYNLHVPNTDTPPLNFNISRTGQLGFWFFFSPQTRNPHPEHPGGAKFKYGEVGEGGVVY